MLFLIEYDRAEGEVISLRAFPDEDRGVAQEARLNLELSLNRQGVEREIVLLEALSEEALRRTHRRYFEDLASLSDPSPD